MKFILLITLISISIIKLVEAAPLDDCDKPNEPPYYYELCPLKKFENNSVNFTGKEVLLISGKSFSIQYHATAFTETQKRGALILSAKNNVRVNRLDFKLRYEYCDQHQCDLEDYYNHLEFLVGDLSTFMQAMVTSSNKNKIENNLKQRLLELNYSISFADIISAVDLLLDTSNKTIYFSFLNPQGDSIAYIRADLDIKGSVKLSEYIYRLQNQRDVSWVGNRDYDLKASDAMWNYLWERELRRVKTCVNTTVQISTINHGLIEYPSTQCWYVYQ